MRTQHRSPGATCSHGARATSTPPCFAEHVKNYEQLLSRVSTWLKPGGKMFVHIFTHKSLPFHYTDGWMAEQFFSGGQVRGAPAAAAQCGGACGRVSRACCLTPHTT